MARMIDKVGVVGLGQMGAGIAEVFARSGLAVVGLEPEADALERGRAHLTRSTERAVQRGRLSAEDQRAMLGRVTFSRSVEDLKDCDLVIEAVPELLDLKQTIFGDLDRVCAATTILATNTSSLSVTEIARATERPSRVVGMHFFNPAPVMKLVEVVRTVRTEPAVVDEVVELAGRLGKTVVSVTDRAGFVANALLLGYLNHSVTLLESGAVGQDDLEAAMRLGAGLPMGPLALIDLIGIDTVVEILDTIQHETGSRRYVAAPTLRRMAAAGLLGRKSGRGFADYGVVGPGAGEGDPADRGIDPAKPPVVGLLGFGAELAELAGVCRSAGLEVVVVDVSAGIGSTLPPDLHQAMRRCDILIDVASVALEPAVDLTTRRNSLRLLDSVGADRAILATTSSTVSLNDCAAATQRQGRVVGLRVRASAAGRAVEVARSTETAAEALAVARATASRLGTVVEVDDRAGGVIDALVMPYLNDALRMVGEGYATADDVDAAMTLGCGYPLGPIARLDELGLDTACGVLGAMHAESGEPSIAPVPLLVRLVQAGRLGTSAGRGVREPKAS